MKDYLSKRGDIQVKYKPKSYNSFVSPGATFEYEIDIMGIEANGSTSDARYGLVSIDNFTKIAGVVVIKNRTPESMIEGIREIIASMGKPKQLYSDEESSMRSLKMVQFLKQNEIKSVQTTTHAHTVERFIRTFKMNLYRRLDALKQNESDWVKHIPSITKNIIQLNIALLKPSLMKLESPIIYFGLIGIYEIMRKEIVNILV